MNRLRLAVLTLLAYLCSAGHTGTPGSLWLFQASQVKQYCGFSLNKDFINRIDSAVEDGGALGNLKIISFMVSPSNWNRKEKVKITFNCILDKSKILSSMAKKDLQDSLTSPNAIPSNLAASVIEEQDSGGRYFRRVIANREISASNWSGSLAIVDKLIGDGYTTPITFMLICDQNQQRSCIEVDVAPPLSRPERKLRPIENLIQTIELVPY